jgi:hypothetical protein
MRLLRLIYPKDDPRRAELLAELYAMKWIERPLFVGEQLETVLCEGVPVRVHAIRKAVRRRRLERLERKHAVEAIHLVSR